MATEKVKKTRKPRKKFVEQKTTISKKKNVVTPRIVQTAKVEFKNKIQLSELPTLEHIDESELNKRRGILIDTSVTSSSVSSIGTPLYKFSGIREDGLSSDVPYLLDESAAKRYRTTANNLHPNDLKIFSDYDQQGIKKTYFNDHPYVVHDIDINSLDYGQLLTKNNLDEAERYFANRYLNSKNRLQAFNWETDRDYVEESNGVMTQEVSGLNDLLDLDKWDSQATYKFEWGNDKRTTNIVDLNINASYYYSVIGIVSVKSIIPDQKSGTIYLEAKPREQDDNDDNWVVIDSAVFKFDQDNVNAGTYVTLSGYMAPNYVTRLKLNLRPSAYSMNNWEYREKGSVSNHYSNTFVGTAYILDDVISGDAIEMPVDIKFTDSNYRLYKIDNRAIPTIDLTNDFITCFNDSQVCTVNVSDVINAILAKNAAVRQLAISTSTQESKRDFVLNGLRYSPTGKIFPLNSKMNLYANCVLYPSYSSGIIRIKIMPNVQLKISTDSGQSWQNGKMLYDLNLSSVSALPDIDWPSNTEIYGNHRIAGKIEQIVTSLTSETYSYSTINRNGPISFNNNSVVSYATFDPRRDGHLDTVKIDFSRILNNYNVVEDITCYITATPRTYGGGSGNESWGRIRYGFTSNAQLNDNNTSAISTIVNPVYLSTRNISRWITNKLCTGSRWNVHEGTLTTSFTQPSRYKQIWIQACADTGNGDSNPTYFSVTTNVVLYFKYKTTVQATKDKISQTSITANMSAFTTGTTENIVSNSCIYPTLSSSKNITVMTSPSVQDTFSVDRITADCSFGNHELTVIPYPQNS